MPRIHLGDWVEDVVKWLQDHLSWLFDFISTVVNGMYDGVNWVLGGPEPMLMAGILAIIAFWMRGLLAGVLAFVGFALIDAVAQWDQAMDSLSLVVVASVVSLVFAIPLGMWAARVTSASRVIRPVLDVMQTMPAFVYLIPAIIFFGLGTVPGVIATIVFSMPVGVRMTELGIRQVDDELVEAADAFGTTPRNTLLKVQLPLALPTIMAGVNQVIMLSLSMVVIAGMVGAEGLGSTVFGAISQVNIGLGFEGGISVVVLAMYLDRITAALGEQVSPLGRRALARMRASVHGLGVIHYRPRPVVGIAGVVILALVAGGMGLFSGSSSSSDGKGGTPVASGNVGHGQQVNLGSFNWDESVATSALWKELLTQRGFAPTVSTYDVGAAFTGLSTGKLDYLTDAWLPTTHESYMKQYGENYTDLGKWYDQTSLEIAVPSYVKGVKSMADLKGKGGEFGGRIIGIEPGAGEMKLLKSKVLPGYGLDKEYQVTSGSTASMLAQLQRDYAKKKPIAVVLWTPHWAYSKYDMTKLSDPKGLWGKSDQIHTIANKDRATKLPQVTKWLQDFHMTEQQLASLEASIQDAGQGGTATGVRAWLKKNPKALATWAPVAASGATADVGKGATVKVGNFSWDESVATAALWQRVLEKRGFKVENKNYDVGAAYTGLSRGDFDFLTDTWLPTTHASYMKQYGAKLSDLGSWYDKTSLEVAVPSYVKGVKSMADLKGKSKEFGGRIIGIEPGAGEMKLLKSKVLAGYGLDKEYQLTSGSTAGMLAQLQRDYAKKKPIAVVLWTPHWAYSKYDMTKLSDPKNLWGKGDQIHTVANKEFPTKQPQVAKWLRDWHMTEPQLASLEAAIQDAGQGKTLQGVDAWLAKNPSVVDAMAPVAETAAGTASAGTGASADSASAAERSRTMNIGYIPWDEGVAVTNLWKQVLGDKGYKTSVKQYDVGPMFTGMSTGQVDVQFDGWLPTTQKNYWEKYKGSLADQGAWYDRTSIELAVPSYVKGVKTLADLKGKGKTFDGKIIGIEPGAEVMTTLQKKVLPAYGLDKEYRVVSGSTSGMLAELRRDYAQKKPVAVLLWSPHWAYSTYDMTKLADPKKAFGTGDHIVTLTHKGFAAKFPTAAKWFRSFKLTEPQLSSLEASIQDAGQGKTDQGVRAWMGKNPDVVAKMTAP